MFVQGNEPYRVSSIATRPCKERFVTRSPAPNHIDVNLSAIVWIRSRVPGGGLAAKLRKMKAHGASRG
jgi:hypothetical protein